MFMLTIHNVFSLSVCQEYEAKLVEMEEALANQLRTDTAVEKLEIQRQVSLMV